VGETVISLLFDILEGFFY